MAKQVDLLNMSVIELKALLFDLDQDIKKLQNDYQIVGKQLEKKVAEEAKTQVAVEEKPSA